MADADEVKENLNDEVPDNDTEPSVVAYKAGSAEEAMVIRGLLESAGIASPGSASARIASGRRSRNHRRISKSRRRKIVRRKSRRLAAFVARTILSVRAPTSVGRVLLKLIRISRMHEISCAPALAFGFTSRAARPSECGEQSPPSAPRHDSDGGMASDPQPALISSENLVAQACPACVRSSSARRNRLYRSRGCSCAHVVTVSVLPSVVAVTAPSRSVRKNLTPAA